MKQEIKRLKEDFAKIKERGWVKSVCKGNNGVGLTLENLLGIPRNELEIPDYKGIELKTKRCNSKSYIILFSSKPEGKYYHESERIKDMYGYPHKIFKQYKVLNNSVYCNKKNKIGCKFYFKLDVDRQKEKVYLVVYDLTGKQIEKDVYWDFETLKEKIYRKLKYVAFIKAYSKKDKENNCEYFKYYSLKIYCLKGFEEFIDLLEIGGLELISN